MSELGKVHGDGTLVSGSIRVVDFDATNNNILIRGSAAFGATNFSMSKLIADIKADVNFGSTGITLSVNPHIVDFCLIGFGSEKDQNIVKAENAWFTSEKLNVNGNSGPYPTCISSNRNDDSHTNVMVYWPIQSIGDGPDGMLPPTVAGESWPVSPANSVGDGATQFNFAGLVPAIRNAVTNKPKEISGFPTSVSSIKDAIIYVHCDSGVNRTGAAVAGYLMMYGSDLTVLNLARTSTQYKLLKAQNAANLAPPSNDSTPPGGTDIPVTEAYCNFLQTQRLDADLVAMCVPNVKI